MDGRSFIDTNILLYAHDATAGLKREQAATLIRRLLAEDSGVVSTQVLMEFYVNATRKLKPPLDAEAADRIVHTYASWVAQPTDAATVRQALVIIRRYALSPWDALIVAAALEAGCRTLYSEDMQHGLRVDTLTISNPFVTTHSD